MANDGDAVPGREFPLALMVFVVLGLAVVVMYFTARTSESPVLPASTTIVLTQPLSITESCRRFTEVLIDLALDDDETASAYYALARQTADPGLAAAIRRVAEGNARHAPAIPLGEVNAFCL